MDLETYLHPVIAPMHGKPDMVFVATRVPYPPVTGHYLRTLNILRGLGEHYSVHFFGFRDVIHGTTEEHSEGEETLARLCASVHIEDVGAERSKMRLLVDLVTSLLTARPYTAAKYSSGTMRRAIRSACVRYRIAVIHADSLQSGQYLIDSPLPAVLTNHNVEYQRLFRQAAQRGFTLYGLFLRFQGLLTRRFERNILHAIGNCVTVSEEDRIELGALVPDASYFVVPNGTDTSVPILPPADPASRSALWVGGMNDEFNRDGVLYFASRVLPRVRAQVPGFQWIVVGRDPPARLKVLAEDADSGVVLAGFVADLREVYARSTVVVAPMLSGGGTKLKVLEAMAMGRAVVTTPVGAEGIAVRDGVDMEIASSDEEFAAKVILLLRDPQRRKRIATAARAIAEREYSWEVVNQRMHAAVQTVIGSHACGQLAACAE